PPQLNAAFSAAGGQAGRGGKVTDYLAEARARTAELARRIEAGARESGSETEVTLSDFDPEGEIKVVAAAMYPGSSLGDRDLMALARKLTPGEREEGLRAAVGSRSNRRHKPGRAFERTGYRFDVLTDYGAFRDLQRHRLLTIEWQALSARHGYSEPEAVVMAGGAQDWRDVMDRSAELYETLVEVGLPDAGHTPV